MDIITHTPLAVKGNFTANCFLAPPRWRFLTLYEFLHFTFPEPDHNADRFSGIGKPDLLVMKPNPAKPGKSLVIVPENTARLLQVGSLHRADSRRICFCVAPPDSLTCDDMQRIVDDAPELNGLQLDVCVLTPAERRAVRSLGIPTQDVGALLPPEGPEARL